MKLKSCTIRNKFAKIGDATASQIRDVRGGEFSLGAGRGKKSSGRGGSGRGKSKNLQGRAIQLLEYQWWEGKFDTLGKLVSAHRADGLPPYTG